MKCLTRSDIHHRRKFAILGNNCIFSVEKALLEEKNSFFERMSLTVFLDIEE